MIIDILKENTIIISLLLIGVSVLAVNVVAIAIRIVLAIYMKINKIS